MVGHLADIITYAKLQDDLFWGYDFTGGSNFPLSYLFFMGIHGQQCSATALPVIKVLFFAKSAGVVTSGHVTKMRSHHLIRYCRNHGAWALQQCCAACDRVTKYTSCTHTSRLYHKQHSIVVRPMQKSIGLKCKIQPV